MKKLIELGMSATLFLSACAPKSDIGPTGNTTQTAKDEQVESELVALWKELNVGDSPNLAAAEIILKTMNASTQRAVKEGTLPTDRSFLEEISTVKDKQKRSLLLRDVPYFNDQQVVGGTTVHSLEGVSFASAGYAESLSLAYEREIQNRAMKNINDTFETRAKEIAKHLAGDILKEVTANDILKIESVTGTNEEKTKEIVSILKKYDRILAGYHFSQDSNAKLIVLGLIAGAIANEISKNKTVQKLIGVAKDMVKTASMVKEVCGLVEVLEKNRKEMKTNLGSMFDSLKGIKEDVDRLRREAEFSLDPKTKAEAKRLLSDLIYGRTKEVDGQGVLSQPIKMSESLTNFANSADSVAKNLSNIVKTANELTATLGIKVDPGVTKALDTASKIAAGVSLAKTVFAAAATGGVIGALSAFSGAGGLSALGIGGGDQTAADIAAIKKDIAEIKSLQKDILRAQIETMKMIQELAKMVESFHREQMYVLREIREEQAIAKEILLIASHEDLQACHTMIEYALSGGKNPFVVENTADLLMTPRSLVFSYISDRESLNQFVKSASMRTYEDCQNGLAKAFGSLDIANGPLKLSMQPSRGFLGTFAYDNYRALEGVWSSVNYDQKSFGIHLPAKNLNTLLYKISYAKNSANRSNVKFETSTLISTEAIERYVSALLILGPLISFDKQDWESFIKSNVLENMANSGKRQIKFLDHALIKIQSAIAQESLIAGEPILAALAEKFTTLLDNVTEGCEQPHVRADVEKALACSIKGNPILRENLLTYVLNRRLASIRKDDYARALSSNDGQAMGELLGAPFRGRLVMKDSALALDWNYSGGAKDVLPDADTVIAGRIKYTENLRRLLSLQQKVVNAILEMTPSLLSSKTKRNYLAILAVKN